jgi:hypothetical protein
MQGLVAFILTAIPAFSFIIPLKGVKAKQYLTASLLLQ